MVIENELLIKRLMMYVEQYEWGWEKIERMRRLGSIEENIKIERCGCKREYKK